MLSTVHILITDQNGAVCKCPVDQHIAVLTNRLDIDRGRLQYSSAEGNPI
jgi:hypothetical protein